MLARLPTAVQVAIVALLLGLLVTASMLRPARGNAPLPLHAMPDDGLLSVMTYNVEGLPFPARVGRGASLTAIGERLRDLRAAGRQPHIVVLQEAFSEDAQRIGALAGYRHIAVGPSRDMAGALAATGADRAFLADPWTMTGEKQGKWLDSGLRILSDYPIVAVRRMAFPDFACAGYDCLANKGAMMVLVAVPGLSRPVAVVNAHLNARGASGVPIRRSLYAWRRQVDALTGFLAAYHVPGSPLIVAGDFNVGKDADRSAYIADASAGWWGHTGKDRLPDALNACAANAPCRERLSDDALFTAGRRRDFQFLAPGGGVRFETRQIATQFGRDPDGSMLSDHVGYTAYYGYGRS